MKENRLGNSNDPMMKIEIPSIHSFASSFFIFLSPSPKPPHSTPSYYFLFYHTHIYLHVGLRDIEIDAPSLLDSRSDSYLNEFWKSDTDIRLCCKYLCISNSEKSFFAISRNVSSSAFPTFSNCHHRPPSLIISCSCALAHFLSPPFPSYPHYSNNCSVNISTKNARPRVDCETHYFDKPTNRKSSKFQRPSRVKCIKDEWEIK